MSEKHYIFDSNNREVLARVGEYLRLCRITAGVRISELSKRTGIARGTFYNVEKGRTSFYLLLWVYKIYCGVDISELDEYITGNIKGVDNGK